jgi:hypothetical protein
MRKLPTTQNLSTYSMIFRPIIAENRYSHAQVCGVRAREREYN